MFEEAGYIMDRIVDVGVLYWYVSVPLIFIIYWFIIQHMPRCWLSNNH